MSEPKAPFYYKKDSDTYHWVKSCSKNHYTESGLETDLNPNRLAGSSVTNANKNKTEYF